MIRFSRLFLKEIFDLQFFPLSIQPGLLTNGLKYFQIWLSFRRVIRIFRGILLSLVILRVVSYYGESCDFPDSI